MHPHPALYRASQFFVAVKTHLPTWAGGVDRNLSAADDSLVNTILSTSAQQTLFKRMPPNDQRHAVAVAHTLQKAGYTDFSLMQAALLHDVGKSLGQPIIHRVFIVLFKAFWPVGLIRLSSSTSQVVDMPWWRRPFVIHAQHPAIGAKWATAAGCTAQAISLIARHQEVLDNASTEPLLTALQWADDLN